MNPRVGRFVASDTWRGSEFEPRSLHKYAYGSVNPLTFVDPSGNESLTQTLASLTATVSIWLMTSPTVGAITTTLSILNFALFLGSEEYRGEFVAGAGGPAAAASILSHGASSIYSVGRNLTWLASVMRLQPSQAAATFQGAGNYPGIDLWRNIRLRPGSIVLGGSPGETDFFTTERAVARSGLDARTLFEGLQVAPHPVHGYRPSVVAYEVLEEAPAAFGIVRANPQFGAGGYPQLFIPNWQGRLRPVYRVFLDDVR
jgi:hypothetical protein